MPILNEIDDLKNELRKKIELLKDSYFKEKCLPEVEYEMKQTRELQGHFQKVYAIDWAGNGSDSLVSASQDGKLILWNALTTYKTNALPLKSCWVMTTAFEKKTNKVVASGGLDNVISVFTIKENPIGSQVEPDVTLKGHQGYISSCSFVDENKIISSSGDGSCKLWDISNGNCLYSFNDHEIDVMSVDVSPLNSKVFISGSIDKTNKIWDLRVQKSVSNLDKDVKKTNQGFSIMLHNTQGTSVSSTMSYEGHESDVNVTKFFPNGHTFASGSDDSTCRLWDLRCHQQVNVYQNSMVLCGVTSLAFSKSGRILFSAYDDNSLLCWDSVRPIREEESSVEPIQSIRRHEAKISTISVHSEGKALGTGSWDTLIKIFA